jgi:hypothetical protein
MAYRNRYDDVQDDEPSRQAPREQVRQLLRPRSSAKTADHQRLYSSRYDDAPSTSVSTTRAPPPSSFRGGGGYESSQTQGRDRDRDQDRAVVYSNQTPPPGLGHEQRRSTSTRGFPLSSPPQSFSTLSIADDHPPPPSTIGGGSMVSHARGIESVERRLHQLKPSPFARRPGHGTAGKEIAVKTNYFAVRPWDGEEPKIIQYVSFHQQVQTS